MVLESKKSHSNLDMLNRLIFIAQIWKLIQSLLHFILKPISESFNSREIILAFDVFLLDSPVKELKIQKSLVNTVKAVLNFENNTLAEIGMKKVNFYLLPQ